MTCDLLLTANRKIDYTSEEDCLTALFDQTAQEPEPVSIMSPIDTLAKSLAEKSQINNLTAPSDQGNSVHPRPYRSDCGIDYLVKSYLQWWAIQLTIH